jgi:hypothetical protein
MIKIINNFFTEEELSNVKNYITNAFFTPQHYEFAKEKTRETYFGLRHHFEHCPSLLEKMIKIGEEKFNIKILKTHPASGIDKRKVEIFQPHQDINSRLNLMVMLEGPTSINNGTVFYTDNNTDIHIGFRENRAVLFPADYTHSPSVNEEKKVERTVSSIFITEYEFNN